MHGRCAQSSDSGTQVDEDHRRVLLLSTDAAHGSVSIVPLFFDPLAHGSEVVDVGRTHFQGGLIELRHHFVCGSNDCNVQSARSRAPTRISAAFNRRRESGRISHVPGSALWSHPCFAVRSRLLPRRSLTTTLLAAKARGPSTRLTGRCVLCLRVS